MGEIIAYSNSEIKFFDDSRRIVIEARENAIRSVDFSRVLMYWNLGQRIFVEEQQGKDRAEYGAYLISGLSSRLEPEFGSGFSRRQLEMSRQFYRTYPNASTLRSQFNWTQYKLLISISENVITQMEWNSSFGRLSDY